LNKTSKCYTLASYSALENKTSECYTMWFQGVAIKHV
jgi:hypothetical protein